MWKEIIELVEKIVCVVNEIRAQNTIASYISMWLQMGFESRRYWLQWNYVQLDYAHHLLYQISSNLCVSCCGHS